MQPATEISKATLAPRSARPAPTTKATNTTPVAPAVYSVAGLCEAYGISRKLIYDLWARGQGPACLRLGRRRVITIEAAKAWAEQMSEVRR